MLKIILQTSLFPRKQDDKKRESPRYLTFLLSDLTISRKRSFYLALFAEKIYVLLTQLNNKVCKLPRND
jgi:hypothetical protein